MPLNVKISPVLCAACGAALSYYFLFPLFRSGIITIDALLVLAFIPVCALCLFRVVAAWPLLAEDKPKMVRIFRLLPLYAAAFSAGLALGIGAGTKVAPAVSFGIPADTIVGVSGALLDDPRLVSGGRAMSTLSLRMAMGQSGARATARGEITVFFIEENAERLREFGRGAEVFAEGNMAVTPPRDRAGGEGAYVLSAETLHVTKAAPPLERFRTGLRLGLTRRFSQSGDVNWGGMSLALLLGIRDNLDAGIAAQYRDSGCSHILALSGMHLAVLVGIISFLLKKPMGLRPAAITGGCIIIAYCFIVGPLPSLTRAALMYLLGVFAVLGMLKRDALLLLCMAFLIQLMFTPRAGVSLSFILSYLALAGILIIGETLNEFLKGKIPAVILQPVSASLGAFIATAGVTAWFFGTLRPVGIAAALVLTPLTTVFMVGSMAWLGLDLVAPPVSFVLGKPLSLLYLLMEKTARAASFVPGIKANPLLVILLSLLTMAALFWLEHRRGKAANRLIPFA